MHLRLQKWQNSSTLSRHIDHSSKSLQAILRGSDRLGGLTLTLYACIVKKRARALQDVAAQRLGQIEVSLTVGEVLSETGTVANVCLSRKRSGFLSV